MRCRACVDVSLWLVASALIACGGDSSDANGGAAGSGGQPTSYAAAGNGGSVEAGTCSETKACPSGYVCVPPAGAMLMTVTDTNCLNSCNSACERAGAATDMCMQVCLNACKTQVPVTDSTVEGTCRLQSSGDNDPSGGGAAGSMPNNGGAAGGTSTQNALVWSGAWTADVSHTSNCEFGGTAMQTGMQSYTVTINATGENSAPKATLNGGFALEGTGGDDHINLTGDFPFRSWKGEVATTNSLNSPNNATIKITTVESAKKISGTIEGSWNASGGWRCTTASGTITLTR